MPSQRRTFRRRHSKKRTSRQTGAGPWRSGADTCVFNPVVKCQNNEDSIIPDAQKANYVSRVVDSTDTAIRAEEFIRTNFRPLVDNKWVSVNSIACVPQFRRDATQNDIDDAVDARYGRDRKCAVMNRDGDINVNNTRSNNYRNLITKKAGKTFKDYLIQAGTFIADARGDITSQTEVRAASPTDAFDAFQFAFSAAFALVSSDTGPWVIHADLHVDNFLQRVDPDIPLAFMLADWGRTITINPVNPMTINGSIATYCRDIVIGQHTWNRRIDTPEGRQQLLNGYIERDGLGNPLQYPGLLSILSRWGNSPQHPPFIMQVVSYIISNVLNRRNAVITPYEKQILRIWTLNSLFSNLINYHVPDSRIVAKRVTRINRQNVLNDIAIFLARNADTGDRLKHAINVIVTKLTQPEGTATLDFVLDPPAA